MHVKASQLPNLPAYKIIRPINPYILLGHFTSHWLEYVQLASYDIYLSEKVKCMVNCLPGVGSLLVVTVGRGDES
jgi:hypothetical protein